ncbi:MAG: HEAT repeat domain-containing protein [Verrucomicrobiota bacterium]|nr:HEAT repeat domain-containing protein [Verrucomicrobiota bacterium]
MDLQADMRIVQLTAILLLSASGSLGDPLPAGAGAEARESFGAEVRKVRPGAASDLKHLWLALATASGTSGPDLGNLLDCFESSSNTPRPVSAERIFLPLLKRLSYEADLLVSREAMQALAPANPDGPTAVEQYGSSYQTWCISKSQWMHSKWLLLAADGGVTLRFPILWEKPDFHVGPGSAALFSDGTVAHLTEVELSSTLLAAKQWLLAFDKAAKSLTPAAESPDTLKIIILKLGESKEPSALPAILPHLASSDSEVALTALRAAVLTADARRLPLIESWLPRMAPGESSRIAVLREVKNGAATELLRGFLKHRDNKVRMEALKAIAEAHRPESDGILEDISRTSEYPEVRAAALEALRK